MAQANPRVGLEARLDRLRRRSGRRKMRGDDPLAVGGVEILDAFVARDLAVPVRTQGDVPGGVATGRLLEPRQADDGARPLEIQVDLVRRARTIFAF